MNIKTMQVGPLGTNCYLLEDEHTHAAAVIDPGGDGAQIEAQLLADGAELKLILLTHAHFDHTGALESVLEETGARCYVSEKENGTTSGFGRPFSAPEGTFFYS